MTAWLEPPHPPSTTIPVAKNNIDGKTAEDGEDFAAGLDEMLTAEEIIDSVVETAKTPECIRGLRNLITLTKIIGSIEPELVEGFARSLPEAIAYTKAHEARPPGALKIMIQFLHKDFRRGLVLVNSLLEAFGRNLPHENPGQNQPPA